MLSGKLDTFWLTMATILIMLMFIQKSPAPSKQTFKFDLSNLWKYLGIRCQTFAAESDSFVAQI